VRFPTRLLGLLLVVMSLPVAALQLPPDSIRHATIVKQVRPDYPKKAIGSQLHGMVTLSGVIGTDGRLKDVHVIEGDPLLADAAMSAVLKWRYNPALRDRMPVEEPTTISMGFTSEGGTSIRDNGHMSASSGSDQWSIPAEGVHRINSGITRPILIYGPNPEYTPRAKKAREQGNVRVSFTVTEEGTTRDIHVEKTDRVIGADLVQNAIDAVTRWKFTPAMKNGQPISVQIGADVGFHLSRSY
jgi:TonB family protein